MIAARRSALCRGSAYAVLVGLTLWLAAPLAWARDRVVPKETLVIFPLQNPQNVDSAVVDRINSGLRDGLVASGMYSVTDWSKKSPPIQRALAEFRLAEDDLQEPFDLDKATKLGAELGCDLVLVGSIEEYAYDEAKKQVELGILVQLVEPTTARLVRATRVTGVGADPLNKGYTESEMAMSAADDGLSQAIAGLMPRPGETTEDQPAVKKKKKNTWLYVLLLGGLIAALSDSGGDGGVDAGDGPPPPPP